MLKNADLSTDDNSYKVRQLNFLFCRTKIKMPLCVNTALVDSTYEPDNST